MYYQSNLAYIYENQSLGLPQNRVEIGDQAVWTLSSSKPGNGVEQLRDQNTNTFWQSDGVQPHTINIQFMKKIRLQEIAIYLDFKCDESYTPNKISFRIGNSLSDLREYVVIDLKEPVGWFVIPFKTVFSNEKEKLEQQLKTICKDYEYLNLHIIELTQWQRYSYKIDQDIWTQRQKQLSSWLSQFQGCILYSILIFKMNFIFSFNFYKMYMYGYGEEDQIQIIPDTQKQKAFSKQTKYLKTRYKNNLRKIQIDEIDFCSFRINVNKIQPLKKQMLDDQKSLRDTVEQKKVYNLKTPQFQNMNQIQFPKISLHANVIKQPQDLFIQQINFSKLKFQNEFDTLDSTQLKLLKQTEFNDKKNLIIINYYGLIENDSIYYFDHNFKKQYQDFLSVIKRLIQYYHIVVILQNNKICQRAYNNLKQGDIDIYIMSQQKNILINCNQIINNLKTKFQQVLYFSSINAQIQNKQIILTKNTFINKIPKLFHEKLQIYLFQHQAFKQNDYQNIIKIALNSQDQKNLSQVEPQVFQNYINSYSEFDKIQIHQLKKQNNSNQFQKIKLLQKYNTLTNRLYYDYKFKVSNSGFLYDTVYALIEKNRYIFENQKLEDKQILLDLQNFQFYQGEIKNKELLISYINILSQIIFINDNDN